MIINTFATKEKRTKDRKKAIIINIKCKNQQQHFNDRINFIITYF